MAVGIETKEANHAETEGCVDEHKSDRKSPDRRIGPPGKKERPWLKGRPVVL